MPWAYTGWYRHDDLRFIPRPAALWQPAFFIGQKRESSSPISLKWTFSQAVKLGTVLEELGMIFPDRRQQDVDVQ
jgi:hypothetical protein